ncbi:NAD-dependent succinate-semialdehyde dehydrogenase [Gordonia terrae]|uniref:NAD-dependent succinate-semialdehyde dehydrogenase n=1 Tax=Gordonia terrae TaxID=2055 RepID=UPI003F6C1884
MALESRNPADGVLLQEVPEMTSDAVETAVQSSWDAFARWRAVPMKQRADLVRALAQGLRKNQKQLAELATLEVGKIIAESEGEVEKSAVFCEYYADNAEHLLAAHPIDGGQWENWIEYEPVGPLLAVMPWNFPYVQVFRFAPAALMAGNTVLLKHASNVPQCALAIEELFRAAGFPDGVFRSLLVEPTAVDGLLADPRVQGVTLTGSERAGSAVAAAAGRHLKRSVMELGGSDPFIVLEDADIDQAVAAGVTSRFTNAGQACINAKRLIVVDAIADEFEERFVRAVEALRLGDPMDRDTHIAPVAEPRFAQTLKRQVDDSIAAGAVLRTGAFLDREPGTYVKPIVLTGVTASMPVFREETFGPVAVIVRVPDEDAAIAAANDSAYGLGGSIWTGDTERGKRIARQVQSGMVFVNAIVVSDARLPFGGMKNSGYGRELGPWGLREFTEIKSIAVAEPRDQ